MDEILAQKAVASASSNIALRQRKYTTSSATLISEDHAPSGSVPGLGLM